MLTRALRGAQDRIHQIFAARRKASQPWPLPLQDQTSICCLRPCRPSQVIEFVFAASPETTRREPQEFPSPSPVAAGPGSLLAVDLFCLLPVSGYATALLNSSAGLKGRRSRSTASKYATNLRATANVARLELPFCFSFS